MTDTDGSPIWFELTTPDADVVRPFYGAVAGWRIAASPNPAHGGYLVAGPDADTGVAGIMTARPGMPTGWAIYVATDDLDATLMRVADLGGTVVVAPMAIPDVGRIAVALDPQGVAFSLMEGNGDNPATAFRAATPGSDDTVGRGVWTELATPDPDAAFAFYGALFGWARDGAMPMGPMGNYAFIGHRGTQVGAVMSSIATGAPAGWSWYVHVADIDAAVAAATAGGGTVRQGPDPIPGGSFAAKIIDPAGAGIGLIGARTR